jgi:hypothetical protein
VWAQDATLFNPYFRLEKVSYAILWSNCKQYLFVHVLYNIKKGTFYIILGKFVKKSASLLIVSKAFVKSIKHTYTFFDGLKALSMIVLRFKM